LFLTYTCKSAPRLLHERVPRSAKPRQSAQVFKGRTMSQPPNLTKLAKVSLWTSIAGLVFPVSLVILLITSAQHRLDMERLREWPYALCGVLFVLLESVALGCGIAARRTVSGKRRLALSAFGSHLLASTLCAFWETPIPVLVLPCGMLLLYSMTLLWRLLFARPSGAGPPKHKPTAR